MKLNSTHNYFFNATLKHIDIIYLKLRNYKNNTDSFTRQEIQNLSNVLNVLF